MESEVTNIAPYLRSLAACRTGIANVGFTENFIFQNAGIASVSTNKVYQQHQINVVAKLRFENNSTNKAHAELYLIETEDGTKGTLIDLHTDQEVKEINGSQPLQLHGQSNNHRYPGYEWQA
jgi:hypothetical protein